MEDHISICIETEGNEERGFFAVLDGHGGK